MAVILIVVDALETISKGIENGLGELEIRGKTLQTTALSRSDRIHRECPRDLTRLAQTSVKDHQLKQV